MFSFIKLSSINWSETPNIFDDFGYSKRNKKERSKLNVKVTSIQISVTGIFPDDVSHDIIDIYILNAYIMNHI